MRAQRFIAILIGMSALALPAAASSHREAPAILDTPQVDGADFYLFRSYEAGREGYVTLIADYDPMQDPFGAPNFFPLRQDAFYDIRIDNTGDAVEDLTFRFRFSNKLPIVDPAKPGLGVPVPLTGGPFVPVGISNVFPAGPGSPPSPPGPPDNQRVNWIRTYTVRLLRGPAERPTQVSFLSGPGGVQRFAMPFDYIGERSFPDYPAYAAQFLYDVTIPGCGAGRLFVGQRKDPFAMNLGEFFDLVHIPNPIGPRAAQLNSLARKNVTALALEVPTACLKGAGKGELLRLNTAIPPVPAAAQSNLGYLGADRAGWPNGRRPGDDVVDITLRVLEGALCYQAGLGLCAPADALFGAAPFTDQTWVDAGDFDQAFPYLRTPIPGAPNPQRIFNAFLQGPGGSGACSALLPPQADPFAPPPDPIQLSFTCTHDLGGSPGADLRDGAGGPVVCDLGSGATPIQITCPLSAAQTTTLQQGDLVVSIGGLSGALQ